MAQAVETTATSKHRYFVISLMIPNFLIVLSNAVLALLLLDIAITFQVNTGVVAQLKTINSIAEVIFGLLMTLLVTKFSYKKLLIVGTILVAISAVGNSNATTFWQMILFFFLEGIGSILVSVMAFALLGDLLNCKGKVKAVSLVTAAGYLGVLIGNLVIGRLAVMGWRYTFSLFVLPVSFFALIAVFFGVPGVNNNSIKFYYAERARYKLSIKQIFSNKSAIVCLIGNLFFAGGGASALFVVTFFRQQFCLSLEYVVYLTLIAAALMVTGSLLTSRLARKISIKYLAVAGALGNGVLTTLLFLALDLRVALFCEFIQQLFLGIGFSAYNSLSLDQSPSYRGTMVSLSRFSFGIGNIITPSIVGAVYALLSLPLGLQYPIIGFIFGFFSVIAGALFLFTIDPYRKGRICDPIQI